MSDTQIAAQRLAQAIARLRLEERKATEATARIGLAVGAVRSRYGLAVA